MLPWIQANQMLFLALAAAAAYFFFPKLRPAIVQWLKDHEDDKPTPTPEPAPEVQQLVVQGAGPIAPPDPVEALQAAVNVHAAATSQLKRCADVLNGKPPTVPASTPTA